jgi:ABC-type polysaccharide/polyol phosphate export permease
MFVYVIASLLPFLILAVAAVNGGLLWLTAMESGTVHRYLLAATPPALWISCRALANGIYTFAMVLVAIMLARLCVAWPMPSAWLTWLGILALQTFAAAGLFFLVAVLCRRQVLYSDLAVLLVFLLMFLSGALTPVPVMQRYDQLIAACTPTYYFIRTMRAVMTGSVPVRMADVVIMALWGVLCFGAGYWRLLSVQLDRNR